jgi:hypothetical protein
MVEIAPLPGVSQLTESQRDALARAADQLGIPVDWLATVISFETGGTFSPTVRNKAGSGAFGLIQFMPSTAQNILGTATRDEAVEIGLAMSFEEQLERMVIPYLAGKSYNELEDVYLQIFYPAARNRPSDYVVGQSPSAVYRQNQGFDRDGKGYITKGDITRTVNNLYARAKGLPTPPPAAPPLEAPKSSWTQKIIGAALAAGAYYLVQKKTTWLPAKFRWPKRWTI